MTSIVCPLFPSIKAFWRLRLEYFSIGQPQNPLLLLGAYSDDDLDEESSKRLDSAISANSPADHNDQEAPLGEGKDGNSNALEDLNVQKVDQQEMGRDSMPPVDVLQGLEGGDTRESDASVSADTLKEKDSVEQISVAGTSNEQVTGEVSAGWRMVVHEESNQYYYWNTETGETSWEIPAVLAQQNQLNSDQKACAAEYMETTHVDANLSSSTLAAGLDNPFAALSVEGSVGNDLIPQSTEVHGNGPQMNDWVEGYRNESVNDKNWAAGAHQRERTSDLTSVNTSLGDGSSVVSERIHDALANDHRGIYLSTGLVKQCENLLERLKSLKGYGSHLQSQDQISKYIIEVEIRLFDIKSLSTHGSPLFPFWDHCERRLKQLEDVINNEIYQLAVSAQMDDNVEATADDSFNKKEQCQENLGEESEADAHENSTKSEVSPVSTSAYNHSHNNGDYGNIHSSNVPSGSPSTHLEGAPVSEELNGTIHLNTEFHPAEDVDMDVDMEVEEGEFQPASITTFGDASTAEDLGQIEKMVQSNPPAEQLSLSSEDVLIVPPPPDEEWIPPPPPDNDQVPPPPPDSEQFPPPPPDEPPECSYPTLPSYPETVQPLTYAEQYNLTYPDLNFQYYGHTVAVPSNFYGNTDGSQAAMPHTSLYYAATPNTYVETTSVMVSVQPVAYYNVQDGSVPVPAVSGVVSSLSHIEAGPVSYTTLASDQTKTGDDSATELHVKPGGLAVGVETESASEGFSSTLTVTEAPTLARAKETTHASSTNAVTATAAAASALLTGAKVQTKVSRKKRTVAAAPSLRSNKKVSSLVDKWKAAKEELNENEEDVPKSAYEILEKKRQREIEEWHAKQISSGEAKDNANFQPLGGDWRERVKRRRAQAAKEAASTPPEPPTDENKQPDLEELSRGLPSGWQVYWDESSKQVYYGNVITSETTWTRPTK